MKNLEPIYDEQIFPLMKQIIEICKEHDIPLIFSCQLTDEEYEATRSDAAEEDSPLFCTTAILPEWCDNMLVQARDVLYKRPFSLSMIIKKREEK